MGVRRLYALVKNLPPEAALWRSMPQAENGDQPQRPEKLDMRKNPDPNAIAAFFKNKIA